MDYLQEVHAPKWKKLTGEKDYFQNNKFNLLIVDFFIPISPFCFTVITGNAFVQ